jgi:hypothetical protein
MSSADFANRLPYHTFVSEWTAKKAAIFGVVCSGISVGFFFVTAVAMSWQRAGRKDWGAVIGVGSGVLFMCCGLAALLSFLVCVSLIIYKRVLGVRQVSPVTLAAAVEPPRRKLQHPLIIGLTGWAVLIVSTKFGAWAIFLVGIPTVLVASAIAGGARSPTKIPLKDAILYVGISVAIVVGALVYAVYHR